MKQLFLNCILVIIGFYFSELCGNGVLLCNSSNSTAKLLPLERLTLSFLPKSNCLHLQDRRPEILSLHRCVSELFLHSSTGRFVVGIFVWNKDQ